MCSVFYPTLLARAGGQSHPGPKITEVPPAHELPRAFFSPSISSSSSKLLPHHTPRPSSLRLCDHRLQTRIQEHTQNL